MEAVTRKESRLPFLPWPLVEWPDANSGDVSIECFVRLTADSQGKT